MCVTESNYDLWWEALESVSIDIYFQMILIHSKTKLIKCVFLSPSPMARGCVSVRFLLVRVLKHNGYTHAASVLEFCSVGIEWFGADWSLIPLTHQTNKQSDSMQLHLDPDKNKCSLTHQCKCIGISWNSCLVIFTNIHRYIQKHMPTYMHMYIHAIIHSFRIQVCSRWHTKKCNWAELEPSYSTHRRMWVGFYFGSI